MNRFTCLSSVFNSFSLISFPTISTHVLLTRPLTWFMREEIHIGGLGSAHPFSQVAVRGRSKTAALVETQVSTLLEKERLTLANAFCSLFFWHFNCHKWQMQCRLPPAQFQPSAFNAREEETHMSGPVDWHTTNAAALGTSSAHSQKYSTFRII